MGIIIGITLFPLMGITFLAGLICGGLYYCKMKKSSNTKSENGLDEKDEI